MNGFELSEFINKPPKEVFDILANPENGAKLVDNIKESKKITPGPLGVGTRFLETRVVNGKEGQVEIEVTAYEPTKHVAIKSEASGIKVEYHYHLQPENTGTRVRWVCELEAGGLRKMMLPMIAGIMKKEDGDHLQKLKQVMEST
ncbi:MAG: SRPBCC family protein [Anaerolineales bacterium]